jgi:U3 small nucleolar RNA-associated protein 18
VAFHPKGELLLTGGMDKTLRFFQVDGKKNSKLDGVFFDDLPIYSASWTHGGDKVALSGRRPFFYMYDALSGTATKVKSPWSRAVSSSSSGGSGRGTDKSLEKLCVSPSGMCTAFTLKDGWVGVVDNRSPQRCMAEVKMNGTARSLAFTGGDDDRFLVTSGGDADVYVWDLRNSGCGAPVSKWQNEGGMPTCALACSPNFSPAAAAAGSGGFGSGGSMAVASESGVVNLYGSSTLKSFSTATAGPRGGGGGAPPAGGAVPWKRVMNLTSPVETLKFNHDGQVSSLWEDGEIKKERTREMGLEIYSKNDIASSCLMFSVAPPPPSPPVPSDFSNGITLEQELTSAGKIIGGRSLVSCLLVGGRSHDSLFRPDR